MKLKFLTTLLSTIIASQSYAHSFSCNVSDVANNSSTPNLVYITMGCEAYQPWPSGTGNCTASTISNNTVAIDGTSELGKRYYAMALTALASQKTTIIAAYGTCPLESPSTPSIYSMRVSN